MGQRITRIALTVLLLVAGYKVFCQVASREIVNRYQTEEGLRGAITWDRTNADAHHLLGLIYRDDPEALDLEQAKLNLKKATELNPYNWRYWLELAGVYEIARTVEEAEGAYLKAVEVNPRAGLYRWRLANFYLRLARLDGALAEFGRAIEFDRGYLQQTLLLLLKSGAPVEGILGIWPEDRQARLMLIRFLINRGGMEGLIDQVWRKLDALDRPTAEEGEFYLRYLLDRGRFQEVRKEWMRLNQVDGFGSFLWNGDFEYRLSGGLLDWKYGNQQITRVNADLRIEFDGTENLDYYGLEQLVIVEPAEYEFSMRVKSESISTEQGLYFEVVGNGLLAHTGMILGTTPWSEYKTVFRVPKGTNLVTVRLRRRPSRRIDNKLSGVLWVDWVRLNHKEEKERQE